MSRARIVPTVAVAAALGMSGVLASPAVASPSTTADAAQATSTVETISPELSISADELSEAEFEESGVTVKAEGLLPEQTVIFQLERLSDESGEFSEPEELARVEVEADASGVATATIEQPEDVAHAVGDYELVASVPTGEELERLPFTVTAAATTAPSTTSESPSQEPSESASDATEQPPSEASATATEPGLTIAPESIDSAAFVDEARGVRITSTGLTPGTIATLEVESDAPTVTSFTMTETADETGTAIFAVYGLNDARPETYVGTYDVAVSAADAPRLGGSFEVTGSRDNTTGGDEAAPADNPETRAPGGLPRTGAEIAGVAAGAALLIIGSATIALSRRRSKPSDIDEV